VNLQFAFVSESGLSSVPGPNSLLVFGSGAPLLLLVRRRKARKAP
jgi:hypothetical protein